ncbi:MAG: hypothetical protein LBC35_04315, partial [Coriobacteriales bacterium]|nr:hypothetical protein [Coriobacteriales bacterium]
AAAKLGQHLLCGTKQVLASNSPRLRSAVKALLLRKIALRAYVSQIRAYTSIIYNIRGVYPGTYASVFGRGASVATPSAGARNGRTNRLSLL